MENDWIWEHSKCCVSDHASEIPQGCTWVEIIKTILPVVEPLVFAAASLL
jgi:hypothetical protein